ncbi:arginine--tRNA ligase [Cocleimonas flava]|uniref:Arginine--tRNA ligase n=1 Tax=Cocleimonas flava TaxID=634765 RepID=A0A4R1ENX0_9GAMM|nr:arginine--tRNA ligase [Cocleimonas flava]TCJ82967.1 arginyl-tRNA synthetase [Cocleimonas flava]
MNIRTQLETIITQALADAGALNDAPAVVKTSSRPEFGDYQANGIMGAAKALKMNPREFAARVLENLDLSTYADKLEIAGPGFINIHLKNEWLQQQVEKTLESDRLNIEKAEHPETVVIDYSAPNLAKEMHVGHLRSTIIGDAIARVLEFTGHKVIRQNHVGDWGTQFGMLLTYMGELKQQDKEITLQLADLEKFYQAAKVRFDEDPDFAKQARDNVVKLQAGDPEFLALWKQFIDTSLTHCDEIYKILNVLLTREDVMPESAYNDDLANVISDLKTKGLLTEDQGAQCVFLEEFKGKDDSIIPMIVQKSDGGYLYATTDLAALRYRNDTLKMTRGLYLVDARQSLHLRQVFAVGKKAGFVKEETSLEHMAFGTMMGKDGTPFKTRTGGTVKLIDLLNEAQQRALDLVTKKNPDLEQESRESIAKTVGIGAVKYADLSKNRTSDYIFNWDTMLSFEGNTAPYLQYAYARIQSIFRKAGAIDTSAKIIIEEPAERQLASKLLQLSEAIEAVAKDGTPNILCNYLYELSGNFMTFYEACPIMKADENIKQSRLKLSQLTANTLKTGLDLLGIDVMERM